MLDSSLGISMIFKMPIQNVPTGSSVMMKMLPMLSSLNLDRNAHNFPALYC